MSRNDRSFARTLPRLCCAVILLAVCAVARTEAQMTTRGILSGATGWYLPTRDGAGELFVFELGSDKDPVIVLHGGPGADFRCMLPIAYGLDTDFHFVFYDQHGSLHSRVIPDSISMAKHVDDLERLREALCVARLSLVSHSAGTMLAFAYLEAHPARVANLVLVGAETSHVER